VIQFDSSDKAAAAIGGISFGDQEPQDRLVSKITANGGRICSLP